MVDALSYFSFQPVLHNCCMKGYAMCYPAGGGGGNGTYKRTFDANWKE